MPNPPKFPLKQNNQSISYFTYLVNSVSSIFEEHGISLNFEGYEDTVEEYRKLNYDEFNKTWELAQQLNAWSEYMASIRSNARKLLQDAETDKLSTIATASVIADSAKVANGDRLANKDENVIGIRRRRNAIEAFCDELDAKISFLERAHYFCKSTCEWQHKASLANR